MYLECVIFYAIKGAHFETISKTILQTLETLTCSKTTTCYVPLILLILVTHYEGLFDFAN